MELNDNNIEEQIMLLADGELDGSAAEAVMAFVGQHAEYQAMLDLYLSVKLQPEEEIVFPGKENLLREETKVLSFKARTRKPVWHWAAAVALLLITGISAAVLFRQSGHEGAPIVAVQSQIEKKHTTLPLPQDSLIATAALKEPIDNKEQHRGPAPQKSNNTTQLQSPVMIAVVPQQRREEVLTLATVTEQNIPVTDAPVAIQDKKEMTAVAVQEPLPAWSPLKEETVQGVNELVAQVRTLREGMREKTQLLKKATIVLRIGNKEIALNK